MANKSLYIKNYISITAGKVYVEGSNIIEQTKGSDFKTFSRKLYKSLKCDYSKFYKMDNLCKLAFLGVELLLKNEELLFPAENTALLFANSGSTIDTDTNFVNTLDKIPSPAIFVYTLPNIAAGELSIRHGWKGENLFLIAETFKAEEFNQNLQMLFADSNTEICITGWIDYFSDQDYKTSIWLITKQPNTNHRELTSDKLLNDFKLI